MNRVCIFAGTTEGRALSQFLASFPQMDVLVSMATEYGQVVFEEGNRHPVTLSVGRMQPEQMESLFPSMDMVIDCTHPYATVVTAQVKEVCEKVGTAYLRILRDMESPSPSDKVVYCADIPQMIQWLEGSEGNILSTLGAKELHHFRDCGFLSRFYPRVLPTISSIQACESLGVPSSHIVAMQGPFSYEMNRALVEKHEIRILLSKLSGTVGGMPEKIQVAEDMDLTLVLWENPPQGEGYSLEEGKKYLAQHFGCVHPKEIKIVSCGMIGEGTLTLEGQRAIAQSAVLMGTERLLKSYGRPHQETIQGYTPSLLQGYWEENPHQGQVTVLVTGDCGFYSAGKLLREAFPPDTGVTVSQIGGMSSLVYLASRLGLSWEKTHCISLHGRKESILPQLLQHDSSFILFDGVHTPQWLCETLLSYGVEAQLHIGEQLGSDSERIVSGTVETVGKESFSSLVCAYVIPAQIDLSPKIGLPDTAFYREEKVPMTKSEVRAVIASKLGLDKGSVVYDIGAGSGSVTVEMAWQAEKVYAFEKNPSALAVLEENRRRFYGENITIVSGDALDSLEQGEFPPPTHVFLGGFSGNLPELVAYIRENSPHARFVGTSVTLETLVAFQGLLQDYPNHEVVEVAVTRGEKRGRYEMMMAQNPIYIFSFQG